jgi:aspartate racemase
MGPEATAGFFERLIRLTPVERESDHLRVVIDSNPAIPDRTAFLLGEGPSPIPALIAAAENLVRIGAELITIPCITAHAFFEDVRKAVAVEVLNALALTAEHLAAHFADDDAIAILSTTGTRKTGLFQKTMPDRAFVLPTDQQQEQVVMDAVYGPKGIKRVGVDGNTLKRVEVLVAELTAQGARGVIAGCTEFGVLLPHAELPVPLIDPLTLLAGEAVHRARQA